VRRRPGASGILGLLAWALVACGRASDAAGGGSTLAKLPRDPWAGAELPELTFRDSTGRTRQTSDLRGQPGVMAFVFTTCAGPCPALSQNFARLQQESSRLRARLVTVSVDPNTDSPEVLSRYAHELGADPQRWWFWSADQRTLEQLLGSLHLALERAPAGEVSAGLEITHSTRWVVFDASGRVRGYYDGESEEGRAQTRARLEFLAQSAP
jgi:cytochrome oxidase Cu insertion factor (SCO1/SenC/PrrC family)